MSRYTTYSGEVGPSVAIHKKVALNNPNLSIVHTSLDSLFQEKLGLDTDRHGIKLYDGSELGIAPPPFEFWREGFVSPITHDFHIPVWEGGDTKSPVHRLIIAGLKTALKANGKLADRYSYSSKDYMRDLVSEYNDAIELPDRHYASTEYLLR
jgi:hypothetical protein